MKFNRLSIIFSLIAFVALAMSSCEKEKEEVIDPTDSNSTNGKTTAVFNSSKTYGTMTDQAGNVYKTITIGTQTWMAENLRTTKFRNGDPIPYVTDDDDWGILTTAAYCNYDNNTNSEDIATYGRLYNWYAVADSRKIAPAGWHVPSDAEWKTLIDPLGGLWAGAGGKMKEPGTIHWQSPNMGATNNSGFTGLPSGYRASYGSFLNLGGEGDWWSSTASDASDAWMWSLDCNNAEVSRFHDFKQYGVPVRLIKD